jgi:hypothetical protein
MARYFSLDNRKCKLREVTHPEAAEQYLPSTWNCWDIAEYGLNFASEETKTIYSMSVQSPGHFPKRGHSRYSRHIQRRSVAQIEVAQRYRRQFEVDSCGSTQWGTAGGGHDRFDRAG